MRSSLSVLLVLLLSAAASAVDLKVKVVDPQSVPVAGAQVTLYRERQSTPLEMRSTSGDGEAVFPLGNFHLDSQTPLRVQVLAPGFAVAWSEVKNASASPIVVALQVAPASETVVVTATRTPAPQQDTASVTSLLTGGEIEVMQPVSLADAVRFLPGAAVNVAGQRGGLGSLFVEGGDSRYNKVLVDGVPINDPGGTFDFSTVPLAETDRIEFLQGAQSTLYGSDAMTSVIQVFARNGTTPVPELRLAADGGTFGTAHGFVDLAGARSRFDYDAFADQFNTNGQGPNADYTNALQGGNFGVQLSQRALLRLRARHSNSRTGVPGEWDFNNDRLLAPDIDQFARANNFLSSADLSISGPSRWQHRIIGYEYNSRRLNEDTIPDRGCDENLFLFLDCPFVSSSHLNRAGFMYQGDFTPREWAQTTVGYEFEDENGRFFNSATTLDPYSVTLSYTAALRLNHSAYVQQRLKWKRLTAFAGVRYVREDASGRTSPQPPGPTPAAPGINQAVPRVALSLLALKGSDVFSGTRLRFSFAQGIKEARFEEEYAGPPFSIPNSNLQPERNRAFETGIEQSLFAGKVTFSGSYFNNLFHDQINYVTVDPVNFIGQYQNVDRSTAQGAVVILTQQMSSRLSWTGSYTYTSSEYLTGSSEGQPLLRRPKHFGSLLATYLGPRWGANLGGSFVGRRTDSDFLGFNIDHAAGYALVNLGGWYAINSRIIAYANAENVLNQHYNEVVGYPALTANFRAGLRFRIGGEK
jgi:outer membrane cobalamin receptor